MLPLQRQKQLRLREMRGFTQSLTGARQWHEGSYDQVVLPFWTGHSLVNGSVFPWTQATATPMPCVALARVAGSIFPRNFCNILMGLILQSFTLSQYIQRCYSCILWARKWWEAFPLPGLISDTLFFYLRICIAFVIREQRQKAGAGF